MTDEEKLKHHDKINESILADWRTLGLTKDECLIAADMLAQLYASLGLSLMLARTISCPTLRTALVSSAVSLGMLKICDGTTKALDWDLQADRRKGI